MKGLDVFLQNWRISKASRYIEEGSRVLDIGSSDGALGRAFSKRIGYYIGVDIDLAQEIDEGRFKLLKGSFPECFEGKEEPFDVITMLAVLEHIPPQYTANLGKACFKFLKPGGKLVITVPSPEVDHILAVLKFCRLIDGMSLHEHHGFKPQDTPSIFSPPLKPLRSARFQLGLNHLFVFERSLN